MAGGIAQCLAGDLQQLRPTAVAQRGGSFDALVEIDLDVDMVFSRSSSASAARPPTRSDRSRRCGRRPEDEVADVADRCLDGVDRPVDPGPGLGRVLRHQRLDILERQRHRVEALDDPVVELLSDALALFDDRQLLDLLVQPRVLDRDARVVGEQLDQLLVGGAENSPAPRLSVRYRLPIARPLTVTGTPSSERIGGMVRREAVRIGMGRDVRDPVRPALADDQPEQPVPACGGGPSSARCSGVIPTVMNRSIPPNSSTIPRAA